MQNTTWNTIHAENMSHENTLPNQKMIACQSIIYLFRLNIICGLNQQCTHWNRRKNGIAQPIYMLEFIHCNSYCREIMWNALWFMKKGRAGLSQDDPPFCFVHKNQMVLKIQYCTCIYRSTITKTWCIFKDILYFQYLEWTVTILCGICTNLYFCIVTYYL